MRAVHGGELPEIDTLDMAPKQWAHKKSPRLRAKETPMFLFANEISEPNAQRSGQFTQRERPREHLAALPLTHLGRRTIGVSG